MRECIFLTMEDPSGFVIYDERAVKPLRDLGWTVRSIPWTSECVRWADFEVVVIRSTWDYQRNPQRFLGTLQRIEDSGAHLMNSAEICRWNIEKTYLRELESRDVSIIPTVWKESIRSESVPSLFNSLSTDRIVVKPIIGAGADDTYVLSKGGDSSAWAEACEVFHDRPAMVQPFVQSICSVGEYSLFYFGGEFSHAIVKTPCDGDFRVQEEHGGIIRAIEPSNDLLLAGSQAINAVDQKLLYARVDLVRMDDGSPALIELELIEPSLYFEFDDESANRFARSLDQMALAR